MNNKSKTKIIGQPIVAIVILVWNNYEDSRECLMSCYALSYKKLMIILVDNASSDGSGHRLSQEFPGVEFIYNKENLGYAGGNNVGIKWALKRGAEFVFMVNNDVVIESKDLIERMVLCFERIPDLGVLGPKILAYFPNEESVEPEFKAGLYNYIKKHFLPKVHFVPPEKLNLIIKERVVVSGCAIMIKRELFEKIGYFNEEFFMFGEENDLCLRAAKAGFLVLYIDDKTTSVKHKGSISYGNCPSWRVFLEARNQFIQLRAFPLYTQFVIVLLHIASLGKKSIRWVCNGEWQMIINSFLGLINGLCLWIKDNLGLSKPGEYLSAGRYVAEKRGNK